MSRTSRLTVLCLLVVLLAGFTPAWAVSSALPKKNSIEQQIEALHQQLQAIDRLCRRRKAWAMRVYRRQRNRAARAVSPPSTGSTKSTAALRSALRKLRARLRKIDADCQKSRAPLEASVQKLEAAQEENERMLASKPAGHPWFKGLDGFFLQRHYGRLRRAAGTEDTYELRNDARLEAQFVLSDRITGKASVDGEAHLGRNDESFHPLSRRLRAFESYLDIAGSVWDARVGDQIIQWGKADEVNPVDNFTPEDFREFFDFERADRKRPVPAVSAKRYFGQGTFLEGVFIPVFEKNLYSGEGSDWEFAYPKALRASGFSMEPDKTPAKNLRNSIEAARLSHSGQLIDWALTYAYHFDQNPSYRATFNPLYFAGLSPSPGTVQAEWQRLHSAGLTFEAAHEDLGVRGEAVYTAHKPFPTSNPMQGLVVDKNFIQGIVGFDYTYHDSNYINLQLLQSKTLNYEDDILTKEYTADIVFRVHKKFLHDQLKIQVSGDYQLTAPDHYYKPEAIYKWTENIELRGGAMFFGGRSTGYFGQFDDNDQIFGQVKYFF